MNDMIDFLRHLYEDFSVGLYEMRSWVTDGAMEML